MLKNVKQKFVEDYNRIKKIKDEDAFKLEKNRFIDELEQSKNTKLRLLVQIAKWLTFYRDKSTEIDKTIYYDKNEIYCTYRIDEKVIATYKIIVKENKLLSIITTSSKRSFKT